MTPGAEALDAPTCVEALLEDLIEPEEEEEQPSDTYAWESGVDRSWMRIRESDLGLKQEVEEQDRRLRLREFYAEGRRQATQRHGQVARNMIRNVVLILDMSESMKEADFRPDRIMSALHAIDAFVRDFFLQNPISQIAMVAMLAGDAPLVTPLSGNPAEQLQRVHAFRAEHGCQGDASFQNGLERAIALLNTTPSYCAKEVLLLSGSIKTFDAGDIEETIETLKSRGMRCSVVSVVPELRILKELCSRTGGEIAVAMDASALEAALLQHVQPPPVAHEAFQAHLVAMGFPQLQKRNTLALCVCHSRPGFSGYVCPKCQSRICEIPTRCKVCGTHLIAAVDLARVFPHLHPPPEFEDLEGAATEGAPTPRCYACAELLCDWRLGRRCKVCHESFCGSCTSTIQSAINQCPSCLRFTG